MIDQEYYENFLEQPKNVSEKKNDIYESTYAYPISKNGVTPNSNLRLFDWTAESLYPVNKRSTQSWIRFNSLKYDSNQKVEFKGE